MFRKILLWSSGIVMIFTIAYSIWTYTQYYSATENMKLEKTILSIVEDEQIDELKLSSLTDFPWDKATVFGPYTSKEEINESLGVKFGQTGGIEMREDIFLLVFLNKEKAVQYAFLERHNGINYFHDKDFITPTDDVIKIDRPYLR